MIQANNTDIINFTLKSYGNSFHDLIQIIKTKKSIPLYVNGTRYFLFVWKGRICYISEFTLCLILCSSVFLVIVAIRKLIKRFKLKKKVGTLIKKFRGGSQILHYEKDLEKELNDPRNYSLLPSSYLDLTAQEKFIKDIVKKCLKPNRIYKITDLGLLQVINEMVDFNKKNLVKVISYDVFVLALVVSAKPVSTIAYKGVANFLPNIASPFLVLNAPIIAAVATAATLAFRIDLNVNLSTLGFKFLFMLLKSSGVFRSAEMVRSQLLIDCTDYVHELPQIDRKSLPSVEPELDPPSSSDSKISYTREYPIRQDTFVSTAPNSELHYQEDFQIKTLDGKFKKTQKLNGDKSFEWCPDRKPKSLKPKYIPLESRTKTLADLEKLDTTFDRKSASKIVETIQKEQITASILDESLE